MNKFAISLLATLTCATLAHAETCYVFKNNQLQSKSQCNVFDGGGVASSLTEVTIGKKSYEISQIWNSDKGESYDENAQEYYINDKPAKHYNRTLSLKITTADNAPLTCYKTKDGKTDLCIAY